LTSNGYVVVKSNIQKYVSGVDVYNFEVEDTHSYFVSGAGVWVHNYNYRTTTSDLQTIGDAFGIIASYEENCSGSFSKETDYCVDKEKDMKSAIAKSGIPWTEKIKFWKSPTEKLDTIISDKYINPSNLQTSNAKGVYILNKDKEKISMIENDLNSLSKDGTITATVNKETGELEFKVKEGVDVDNLYKNTTAGNKILIDMMKNGKGNLNTIVYEDSTQTGSQAQRYGTETRITLDLGQISNRQETV